MAEFPPPSSSRFHLPLGRLPLATGHCAPGVPGQGKAAQGVKQPFRVLVPLE
jgi:hypothetical protein